MKKSELRKEPYEVPRINCLAVNVEGGFGVSTENGAGGGQTGNIGEYDAATAEANAFETGSWSYEEYL